MMPYVIATMVVFIIVILGFYLVGLPIGVGVFPGVTYGA